MFKNEILEELKKVKYNDLEDLVYRFRLTYDEIMDILDLKYISTKRMGFSTEPNIYNVVDLNKTLKNILPDNVKIDITIDERKYKTDLNTNQTLLFTKKIFLLYNFRFHSISFLSFRRHRRFLSIDFRFV